MCPIEKYIKTKRKPSDAKSLFLSLGVISSFSADTAFSTRALHAAQLIPVILYLSVFLTLSLESGLFQVYYLQLRRKYTIKVCFSQYPNEIFSVSAENEPFGEQKKTTPATVTQAFVMFLI